MINEGFLDAALTLSAELFQPGTKWYENEGCNIINKKDIPGYSLFTTHHKREITVEIDRGACRIENKGVEQYTKHL